MSLGVYPAVDLKTARERRDQARKLVAAGFSGRAVGTGDKLADAVWRWRSKERVNLSMVGEETSALKESAEL